GQYRRVGGRGSRKADVRIICATNRHLWDHVKAGQFREDLYYRIACLAVRLPPLRERLDDVGMLAPNLLEVISRTMSRNFVLSPDAIEQLKQYQYPGNVRELRNILFIAATHSSSGTGEIDAETVVKVLQMHAQAQVASPRTVEVATIPAAPAPGPGASLHDVEAQHISQLLQEHHNNRRKVAQALGISERTLYRKLKRFGLS
ncbi:MAG: helix-turn-helix domain-containing protein, partial [Gammaproteobacteria bacterium]